MAAIQHDVFLSYSWRYPDLAGAMVQALEAHGLSVFRDNSGMDDYDEITAEIDSALCASRTLVALYTPEFARSAYCRWELYTALTRAFDLDGHTGRILPVLHGVDYAEVRPARLAAQRLPAPDTDPEAVARSIAVRLRDFDDRVLGDAPARPEPNWYPYPAATPRSFTGRLAELWDLHDALVTTDDAEHRGPHVVRLIGLGGQGKTMLAEEYARRFARDHPAGVFVLRGFGSHERDRTSPPMLRAWRDRQVTEIVARLGYDPSGLSGAETDGLLRRHLDGDGHPYLWIVDDLPMGVPVATFQELIAPTSTGRTLMTTRDTDDRFGGRRVTLGALDDQSAVELLTSRRPAVGAAERRHARRLAARDLGGHAQALELASGLTDQPDFAGYDALRADITTVDRDVLQLAAGLRTELPGGHRTSVAATLLRSIEKASPAARRVLRLVSLLAPAPVPQPLLAQAFTLADASERDAAAATAEGLADAAGRGLATQLRADDPPLWLVHAMITRTIRFDDPANELRDQLRLALVGVLVAHLDRSRADLRYRWLADYLPHVAEVAQDLSREDERHARHEATRAYVELGDLDEAAAQVSTLYQACRDLLGDGDVTTLAVLVAVAAVEGLRGRHQQAMDLKIRAYEGLRALLGPDDTDTITALNNIGVGHLELREAAPARRVLGEVYRARRRRLGLSDTDTLVALGNYAIACAAAGDHAVALRLRTPVYQRLRRLLGDEHPLTLEALNNLGASQLRLGDPRAAHTVFRRVYEARSRTLGSRHPNTATAVVNLAITQADPDQVVSLLDQAYRTLTDIGDPGAPHALAALRNLLVARHRRLGLSTPEPPVAPDNPITSAESSKTEAAPVEPHNVDVDLTPLEDFDANTDARLGTFLLAETIHGRLAAETGPGDPATMLALAHLAHATASLGQIEQQLQAAKVLAEDAAEGLRETVGANHPDTVLADRLRSWIDDVT